MHQSLSARVDTTDNGKSKDKEKSPRSTPAAILALSACRWRSKRGAGKVESCVFFSPVAALIFPSEITTANRKLCCTLQRMLFPDKFLEQKRVK
jgi:hypothetical protein